MPSHLTLVTSHRPAILVDRLSRDLGRDPPSPFDEDVVVVQSLGTERWVRHELACRHGCAASIQFPFPAAFCHRLAASLAGDGRTIDERFGREALTWRILELLEGGIADGGEFEPLRRFAVDADTRKRLGLAARVAGRFDDYQLYRPDVLLAWERGEWGPDDTPHVRWQAALWRRLCQAAEPPYHFARWFTGAVERIEGCDAPPPGLPSRISVFGVSTLPPLFVRLLRGVARFVPVRVYVIAPPRRTWLGTEIPANPMAAAFGGASRELLALCDGGDTRWEEYHDGPNTGRATCLRRLQDDLRDGVARGPEEGLEAPVPIGVLDHSLGVHVCHSPMREMEVLRDQLLAAFAADPTLRPHDVLMLVPDVEAYAPFVHAVFGVGEPELPRIPYHVADRPVAHESSLATAALRLLHLAGARWTAVEVVELLELPAVRRAAGIPDGATGRVLTWIRETRIRWGRDGTTRRALFDLPAIEDNSWRAGLDRLLMGYAVGPEDTLVADVLPYAGHTTGDPETLGAFAHWTERLFRTLDDWRTPRPLAAWGASLREAVTALLEPADEQEEWALDQLLAVTDTLATLGPLAGCDRALDVAVVRDWFERALTDDGTGSGFLGGGMTVSALKPMRAIPFRVIAVAGLDDAAFPRSDRRAAYDLLEIAPRKGDRGLRADDRQLFLDTILSAGDRLILSYVGRSAKSNVERAPSVVVAELLDAVDRSFTYADAGGKPRRARDAVVVEHRLQPFSPAYYGGDDASRLFSYSRVNARATAVAAAARRPVTPFVTTPVMSEPVAHHTPAGRPLDISLADLIDCWTNPSRFFCKGVLHLHLPGDEETVGDCEPLEVDALTRYAVHEAILRRHLAGTRAPEWERREVRALGSLPSGTLAGLWFDRLDGELADFLGRVGRPAFAEPVSLHVGGTGWTLTGRVDGVTAEGRAQVHPAKLKPKDRVRAWITHVALSAHRGAVRTRVFATDASVLLDYVDRPHEILDALVAGYRAALAEPLPVFERASFEYVQRLLREEERAAAVARGERPGRVLKGALEVAREAFIGNDFGPPGDRTEAHVALCWRGRDPFVEPTGFARWSETLWREAMGATHNLDAAPAEGPGGSA